MMQLNKQKLKVHGKLAQMAWRYLAMNTRPKRLEAYGRFARLVNKYRLYHLKMARFARIRAWGRFYQGLTNIEELANMTPAQKWKRLITRIKYKHIKDRVYEQLAK